MGIYSDLSSINANEEYYIFMGGRNCGRSIKNTIPYILEWLFGGSCEYHYDVRTQIHHYFIKMMM